MDGALTPVNSPAVTLNRRRQPGASASQSSMHSVESHGWESTRQQPAGSQPQASMNSMQEMDSLLAAEKVSSLAQAMSKHFLVNI